MSESTKLNPPPSVEAEAFCARSEATDALSEVVSREYAQQLWAEIERLKGIRPELPPREPDGEGLPRYGLRWNGPTEPLAVPMADGYWTPWHLAARVGEDARSDSTRESLQTQLETSTGAERDAFERYILTERGEAYLDRDEAAYVDHFVQEAWEAWQARAASAPAPVRGYLLPEARVQVLVEKAREFGVEHVTFGVMKPGAGFRGLPDYYGVFREDVSRLTATLESPAMQPSQPRTPR